MRNRRHVRDIGDTEAHVVQGPHGGFTARAGALDANFQVLQAVILSRLAGALGRHLGGKGRALARAAKARATGGRPGQGVTLPVCNRDNRIVKRGVDVGYPVYNRVFNLLL
jgi:hypothetical protein